MSNSESISFADHKAKTLEDLGAVIEQLQQLRDSVAEGDMGRFEAFWIEGGTEEGDAKIRAIREMVVLRYCVRLERLEA